VHIYLLKIILNSYFEGVQMTVKMDWTSSSMNEGTSDEPTP